MHSRLQASAQRPIDEPQPVSAESMRDFLRQRRSVRNYRARPIPRELLTEIAEAAGYAPTGAFGGAGWERHVTIVTGQAPMHQLREATVAYLRELHRLLGGLMLRTIAGFSAEARSALAILPDLEMRLAEWNAGRDAVTYDAPAAIFVSASFDTATPHQDCDGALMNMMLAAKAHGLGTCWNGWLGNAATGAHVSGPRLLGDLLQLPSQHHVCEAITLGWPSFEVERIPERVTHIHWCEG
jgi:nitroreductase